MARRLTAARRAYMARWRLAHPMSEKEPCPECGALKERTAVHCRKCSNTNRGRRNHAYRIPMQQQAPTCPYCEATMRAVIWLGVGFWHCTGCGLETTPVEIKRIGLELREAA